MYSFKISSLFGDISETLLSWTINIWYSPLDKITLNLLSDIGSISIFEFLSLFDNVSIPTEILSEPVSDISDNL